jgi:hypothetical protein
MAAKPLQFTGASKTPRQNEQRGDMMKEMCKVNVFTTDDGKITIQSFDATTPDVQSISITPEQAELLTSWILEAKAELESQQKRKNQDF